MEAGSVVTSNFSATNSATFSLGSVARFSARPAGTQARAINPHNSFIAILLRFYSISGDLAWSIHAAQEPSEVARQCHKRNRDRLDGQAVTRQNSSMAPPRSQVDKKHHPDQQAGSAPKDQMHQENAFE